MKTSKIPVPASTEQAMQSQTIVLVDESATLDLGRALAQVFRGGGFIGLIGELGAGKTTLVKGILGAVSTSAEASSPTYTLLNIYETIPPVYHFDLYRLENADDLESVGYWDYVDDRAAICCVEWIDRVESAWPGRGVVVRLIHADSMRKATLEGEADVLAEIISRMTT